MRGGEGQVVAFVEFVACIIANTWCCVSHAAMLRFHVLQLQRLEDVALARGAHRGGVLHELAVRLLATGAGFAGLARARTAAFAAPDLWLTLFTSPLSDSEHMKRCAPHWRTSAL